MRGLVKEVRGVTAGAALAVALVAKTGKPVICGIEVVSDTPGNVPPEVHHTVVQARPGTPVSVRLPYTDPDGPGPFTFKITTPPAKGSLSGRGPTVRYTAKPGAVGTDTFAWVVHDGRADSPRGAVTVKLAAANVAPKAQDTSVRATAGQAVRIAVPFTDIDDQPGNYRFELVKKPAGGTVQWLSHNRFVYTPRADFTGTDRFTWKVHDGQADSNVATVTVAVTPDTQPPTVAWIDSAGPNNRVKVVFAEPVAKDGAAHAKNYTIDHGVTVTRAVPGDDAMSVTLTTSPLKEGVAYALALRNVRDRAAKPNTIVPGTRVGFTYVFVGNGLWGEYYEGKDFTGKKIGERVDPRLAFDWRTIHKRKRPFPSMKPGVAYSVRWTGRIEADHTEPYMLYLYRGGEHNHNPARVWVDGKLLAEELYGPVSLEAGKTYDLKVELNVTRTGRSPYDDRYILQWSSLSTRRQAVPQANLGTLRSGR